MAENSPNTGAKKPDYFPAIDGLRLLASINIVMLHLGSSNALAYMANNTWLMPVFTAPAFAAGIF
jgi:peptidoglycan/LPS O-acetylase OafA/YrhL